MGKTGFDVDLLILRISFSRVGLVNSGFGIWSCFCLFRFGFGEFGISGFCDFVILVVCEIWWSARCLGLT